MKQNGFTYNPEMYRGEVGGIIRRIISSFDVDDEEITLDSNLFYDFGFDSLDLVETIMAAEKEFGIYLPDEEFDLDPKEMTVRKLVEIVKKYYD